MRARQQSQDDLIDALREQIPEDVVLRDLGFRDVQNVAQQQQAVVDALALVDVQQTLLVNAPDVIDYSFRGPHIGESLLAGRQQVVELHYRVSRNAPQGVGRGEQAFHGQGQIQQYPDDQVQYLAVLRVD